MGKEYENAIVASFEGLDPKSFRVHLELRHIFVCGGEVDGGKPLPPSLRDRFITYSGDSYQDIHDCLVLAEKFKDYFKENAYPDLFVFENEIASISSLVMIFLESPGSLVELGMFCAKPELYKKMLVVAPREKLEDEDSFIYLGPLENIKRKDPSSVLVYPWPDGNVQEYDKNHLIDICEAVRKKWSSSPKTVRFSDEEPGHLALLIAEIIRISFPVLIGEIEIAIMAMNLDVSTSKVYRLIYLLDKIGMIRKHQYGGYDYYYFKLDDSSLINFSGGKKFDFKKVRMNLRQTYVMKDDDASRKRQGALKGIKALGESTG